MDKKEKETKRDEILITDFAEKLELVANTIMGTIEKLLHKCVAKYILKNKMITVAGQMFIKYEQELDNSNQKIEGIEDYFGE